jgi:acetyl esterase/lipase
MKSLLVLTLAVLATHARVGFAQHFATDAGLTEYIANDLDKVCGFPEIDVALREGLLSSPLTELLDLTRLGPDPVTQECNIQLLNDPEEDSMMAQPNVMPLQNRDRSHELTPQEKGPSPGNRVFDGLKNIYYIKPGEIFPPWNCDKDAEGLSRCYDKQENTNVNRGYALSFVPKQTCKPAVKREGNFRARHSSVRSSQERRRIEKVLFVHGGSWSYGSPSTASYGPFAARLAESTCLPLLSIDYSLAPIGDAPSILKQVQKALQWMGTHDEYGEPYPEDVEVDVIIAGDSSGGGTAMSTLVANQESKKGSPAPSWWSNESENNDSDKDDCPWFSTGNVDLVGGILFSPWLNLKSNTPTYFSNAPCYRELTKEDAEDGCPLEREESLPQYDVITGDLTYGSAADFPLEFVLNCVVIDNGREQLNYGSSLAYLGNDTSLLSEPIFNIDAGKDFSGIPKMQIHTSLTEVLAAESSILSDQLPESELHLYNGMWHDFATYFSGCQPVSKPNQHLLFAESVFKLVHRFATEGLGRRGTTNHYEYPWGHDTGMVGF